MTAQEAVDAMLGIFSAAWVAAGYDVANVRWDDVNGALPTGDVVWARTKITHTGGDQVTMGATRANRKYENIGFITVQVFAPVGEGDVRVRAAAQDVVNGFREANNVSVWFRNIRMKEVGNSGAFQQFNVLADFTYDD